MADNNKKSPAVSKKLLEEICNSLHNIRGWGSVEIFIQDYKVTQVIEKNIKKPSMHIHEITE